jgi:prefoldin beta subunit
MEQEKIQEFQTLEQALQNILLQKQTFQMELSETQSALKEIQNSDDEVFKIVGQLMIKTEKQKIMEELANREKILELRLNTIDKQEGSLTEKLEKLREEFIKSENS